MSGQPLRNPLDASKFREAYVNSLNLRISLDDKNLQANKVYQRTGQLPVEMSDFRTSEEKLADTERLKMEVRSKLAQIADGQNANKIAQILTAPELTFYFQQSGEINPLIRQRYSAGVLADIFIPFLQKYMIDTQANLGVASGLQQSSGSNLLLSGQNVLRGLATYTDYIALNTAFLGTGITLGREFVKATSVLPATDLFEKVDRIPDANEKFLILEAVNNYLKDLPSKREILKRINNVERLKQLKDIPSLRAEADRIRQFISPTADTYDQLKDIQRILYETPETYKTPVSKPLLPDAEELGYGEMGDDGLPEDVYVGFADSGYSGIVDSGADGLPEDENIILPSPSPVDAVPVDEAKNNLLRLQSFAFINPENNKGVEARKMIKGALTELNDFFKREISRGASFYDIWGSGTSSDVNSSNRKQNQFIYSNQRRLNEVLRDYQMKNKPVEGKGIRMKRGCGLAVVKRRQDHLTKADVAWGSGVSATERFVPFGRYIINRHRLNDDVIAIKRPAGSCIKDFPSTRVSRNLGGIIRKIAGNGIPNFDDLEMLDDGEKSYLHKLTKESRLLDRLSIPAPKKSEIDKDLNEFEIMKGQIMSGNDNAEMVKKFKMMLLKLSNKGALPKSQVREILFDLTNMGF